MKLERTMANNKLDGTYLVYITNNILKKITTTTIYRLFVVAKRYDNLVDTKLG